MQWIKDEEKGGRKKGSREREEEIQVDKNEVKEKGGKKKRERDKGIVGDKK